MRELCRQNFLSMIGIKFLGSPSSLPVLESAGQDSAFSGLLACCSFIISIGVADQRSPATVGSSYFRSEGINETTDTSYKAGIKMIAVGGIFIP